MKKLIAFILCLAVIGCADDKVINGKTYEPYGFLSLDDKDPCIHYRGVLGNAVWGIVLIETVVMPIYFFGFSLFEPTGENGKCPS